MRPQLGISTHLQGGIGTKQALSGIGLRPRPDVVERWIDRVAACPWGATAGAGGLQAWQACAVRQPLYTAEQRARRDATGWTVVQGVLAPIQFGVFVLSLGLVLNYLAYGQGYQAAAASVVLKTLVLYAIMVTGSIWEKKVFGQFLFADSFFWEDVVSILVLTLHTAYLVELVAGSASPASLMGLALAAYASYAVNATQFLLKLRAARLEAPPSRPAGFATGRAE